MKAIHSKKTAGRKIDEGTNAQKVPSEGKSMKAKHSKKTAGRKIDGGKNAQKNRRKENR